ncbi:DUF3800 domain-containing protein, partial [Halobellus sp. Atlit-31R]
MLIAGLCSLRHDNRTSGTTMTRYAAYIDESGNHDLSTDKDGASKYFLVLAVVIEEEAVPELTAA